MNVKKLEQLDILLVKDLYQLGEGRVRNNEREGGGSVCGCGARCILGSRVLMTVCITSAPHQCRVLGKQKRVKGKNGFFILCRVT